MLPDTYYYSLRAKEGRREEGSKVVLYKTSRKSLTLRYCTVMPN